MDIIDNIYTDKPFYGSRRIRRELFKMYDITIGRNKISSLMKLMGIEAIYPKSNKNLSKPDNSARKYPYLLKDVKIKYPNHVWGSDITYIKLLHGWAYLVAIIDWYSRYVLSWKLSNTLETTFCIEALEEALSKSAVEIFNSDQGSQYTSENFTELLLSNEVKISMDGRGRCMDNIFTERLWRTVKYENVYIKSYENMPEAKAGLREYFEFYNNKRYHQSLDYQTPFEVYFK